MLKIQVLGNGMIPRGMGLAPRKAPFKADLTLIATIMNTPGLQVNFLNPETNKFQALSPQNVKRMWEKYANWESRHEAAAAAVKGENTDKDTTVPHTPDTPKEPSADVPPTPSAPPAQEEKPAEQPPVNETPTQNLPTDTPTAEPEAHTEEKKDTPAESEKTGEPTEDTAAAAAAAALSAVSGEKKDETPSAAPAPLRTVYNNGQKNNKHNK